MSINYMVTLKGKGFVLRYYKKGDEVSVTKHINNIKIYRYTCMIPYPYTLKDGKEWARNNIKNNKKKKKENVVFLIIIDGEAVGGIGLHKIEDPKAEIGYWLGEKYWGKGIVPQAVKLVAKYGFEKLKLKRIYGTVMAPNKQSQIVMKKAGFKLEGKLRKYYNKDGKIMDAYMFANVKP